MEEYKQINTEENYNKLLNSGMFWEMHPNLTGMWKVDKKLILPVVGKSFYCNCTQSSLQKPISDTEYECFDCGKELKQ